MRNAFHTSTDGMTWNANSGPGGTGTLMSVVYGSVPDLFVACGSSGTAYCSRNATAWTPVTTGTGDTLTSVAYGGGLYVACAQTASRAYYSSDGASWSESVVALEGYDIIYDNGLFLMGGNGGYSGYATAGEVVASDWNSIRQESWYSIYGYAYGNSVYVGITVNGTIDVCAASDMSTWTNKFDAGVQLNAVAFGNGHFVTVGNSGTIYHSSDSGNTWAAAAVPVGANILDVCYAGGKFVAVGAGGTICCSTDNGATWTAAVSPGTADLQGICYRP